jgi:hypothetical protein
MVALVATRQEALVPEEVGEKVDREGVIRAKRIESFTRDHPEGDAVLADPAGAL